MPKTKIFPAGVGARKQPAAIDPPHLNKRKKATAH
jgi:hypothetical protein